MKSAIASMFAAMMIMTPTLATAAPPANLGNTTWTVRANGETVSLVITNQGGGGGAGGSTCPLIIGELAGVAPIRGWYCPSTGRVHFLHNNADSGATVRVFTGNVSDEVNGQPTYMAGTMTVVNAAFGAFGEYPFSAAALPK